MALQEHARPDRWLHDPDKLGYEIHSVSMRPRLRDEIRAEAEANPTTQQVFAISRETPDPIHICSQVRPVLRPTLVGVQDVSEKWEAMAATLSDVQNQLRDMKARNEAREKITTAEIEALKASKKETEVELKRVVPLANQQYLVLCAETARLVVDHLDQLLLASVGRRLEKVDVEMKEALLSGPFVTFKAKEHDNSGPRLCGSYGDLVKAAAGAGGEKYKDILQKIESEFLKANTQFTIPELREQVTNFANLKLNRNLASHHMSEESRAKLITSFINNGGLETDETLFACSPFISLGITFLLEGSPQIHISKVVHHPVNGNPVKKKRSSQKVVIRVEELEFEPGHELKISGPVSWCGGGVFKKAKTMKRDPRGWLYKGTVGIPEDELPYFCEIIKYEETGKKYHRGSRFSINPAVDEDEIYLASWHEPEPEYVVVEAERRE